MRDHQHARAVVTQPPAWRSSDRSWVIPAILVALLFAAGVHALVTGAKPPEMASGGPDASLGQAADPAPRAPAAPARRP
jgi:hypothetical protein